MQTTIPLSSPDLCSLERKAVLEVLDSSQLSLGPQLGLFECEMAVATETRFGIAVNSGTSGLHLCIKAARIKEGDEVITTPFSFIASANCILYEGGTPRFVDIDPDTLNIDPWLVRDAINERTKAILPVHVFGRPCDMAAIMRTADKYDLFVIEDACEAIGARYHGRSVASFGHCGVFAFYPNKQITTGEGGMIVTSDENIARLCRSWRNQGRGESGAWLQHERLGYNYRLSDINCALGRVQLSCLHEITAKRRRVAASYAEALTRYAPDVILPAAEDSDSIISWFVYVVRLPNEFTRIERDLLLEHLRREGIQCNNYFTPIHLQPFDRERFGYRLGDFPVTEFLSEHTVALPFFNNLSDGQIEAVSKALARAMSAVWAGKRVVCAIAAN